MWVKGPLIRTGHVKGMCLDLLCVLKWNVSNPRFMSSWIMLISKPAFSDFKRFQMVNGRWLTNMYSAFRAVLWTPIRQLRDECAFGPWMGHLWPGEICCMILTHGPLSTASLFEAAEPRFTNCPFGKHFNRAFEMTWWSLTFINHCISDIPCNGLLWVQRTCV